MIKDLNNSWISRSGRFLCLSAVMLVIPLFTLAERVKSSGNTAYYINSRTGDDASDGISPSTAWKSFTNINNLVLASGDQVLFKAGCRFSGSLRLEGSGSKNKPIRVASYGFGPFPLLAGQGKVAAVIDLKNGEHWKFEYLEITNTLPNKEVQDHRYGIRAISGTGGAFKNISFYRLHIHHVSGGWERFGGAGIYLWARGESKYSRKSYFDGVRVEE